MNKRNKKTNNINVDTENLNNLNLHNNIKLCFLAIRLKKDII